MPDFFDIELRVGEIVKAETFAEAKKPAYKLWINFGAALGIKTSSAQITSLYTTQMLIGKLVIAVTNLEPKQVGPFISEVLLLGVDGKNDGDIILIAPDDKADIGNRVH
ncbi:MAG: tRNA-binding protein [Paracoccaceae bacterium]|jgi:tRNA-binding protein|nr:MAG: tRNA-binding protein [Alphaproteobacteria bacterium]|tara:strand:+ start:781 stop:1107 length:327 start_codon:yes stop_codon:yes gene_type:complete